MVIEEFRNIRIAYMRRTGEYGIKNKELMETFKAKKSSLCRQHNPRDCIG